MSNSVPNNVNVYQDTPNQVIVEQDAPNIVVIRSTTPYSLPARRHIHNQTISSDTWIITHSLGGYPSVTIVDSAKTYVIGEVQYDSTTQITVSFSAAFSGYAYLT